MKAAVGSTSSLVLLLLAAFASSGCVGGPHALRLSRSKFNRVILETDQEEMLLNLVRLKYREAPKFVDVAGVAEQFAFSGDGGVSAKIPKKWFDGVTLAVGGSVAERPTLTYAPQHGENFNRRLLSPISIDTMSLLSLTGWRIDTVLRMTVQSINDVYNASTPAGPTGNLRPEYEEFMLLTQMFRQLQLQRQFELIYSTSDATPLSPPIPRNQLTGTDLIAAADAGYSFRPVESVEHAGGLWQLYSNESYPLVVRIDPAALESSEMATIVDLLGLSAPREVYQIEPAVEGQLKYRQANQARERDTLSIARRSFLEIMYFLSHSVSVPEKHVEQGLVPVTCDYDGSSFDWRRVTEGLMQIHCSRHKPTQAAVAVQYRGVWFYIADNDLTSKATFALLLEIYNIEMRGGGGGTVPVLTLGLGS